MATESTTKSELIRYALLPGIVPRVSKLFGGFPDLAFLMIAAFHTLKIIPHGHLYLRSDMRGQYSVLKALGAISSEITFDRKNIDKIAIFAVLIGGLMMLMLQFVLGILALVTGRALAYTGPGAPPSTFGELFDHPNPTEDIAFRMLDLIFGIEGIFESKDMGTSHFHLGLHALFEFYSYGILLVGTFVIIYLATRIVLETAQSGVPFGERFESAWAPVRLILFFGLLLPTASGINVAQYLFLESARLGSNLATNAWLEFDDKVSSSLYLGPAEELVAEPIAPNLSSLISFMQIAKTCQWAQGQIWYRDIKPYAVFSGGSEEDADAEAPEAEEPAEDETASSLDGVLYHEITASSSPPFTEYSKRTKGGNIFIRFGVQDDSNIDEEGTVVPHCGELMLTVVDQAQPGATVLQQAYLDLIQCFWFKHAENDSTTDIKTHMNCGFLADDAENRARAYVERFTNSSENKHPSMFFVEDDEVKAEAAHAVVNFMADAVKAARQTQIDKGEWMNDAALAYGWAGAGIWYNKIAEQNGALTAAAYAKPDVRRMPETMAYVESIKRRDNQHVPYDTLYSPVQISGDGIEFNDPRDRQVHRVLNEVFGFWGLPSTSINIKGLPETQDSEMTGNIILDVMNTFMGTRGLFDMCRSTDVHPLAQLTALGKGLIEHSIRGFAIAAGTGIGGGVLAIFQQHDLAQVLYSAGGFFMSFAGIGLLLGFVLFYAVPFMPFIYFFFAVMTWAKSIFQAMVAAPLWALAHLHVDGPGMPGEAAASGYFHILEIFLRPILILIGLLGGIAIFGAMVKVMNQIFYLVVSNLTGHYIGADTGCFLPPGVDADDASLTQANFVSGTIDEFFYTVIYTIIVYMMAVPCFKLVDMIPDHVMAWLGSGISPFGAQDGDPAEGMLQHVSLGAASIGSSLQAGIGSATGGFNSGVSELTALMGSQKG